MSPATLRSIVSASVVLAALYEPAYQRAREATILKLQESLLHLCQTGKIYELEAWIKSGQSLTTSPRQEDPS